MTIGSAGSGVTSPQGFRAAGIGAGIKRANPAGAARPLDLALIVSDVPATASAVFTTNRAQAAPMSRAMNGEYPGHGSATDCWPFSEEPRPRQLPPVVLEARPRFLGHDRRSRDERLLDGVRSKLPWRASSNATEVAL